MIIDGRAIASDILSRVSKEVSGTPLQYALRAIVMQPSAATESYLRIKEIRAQEAGIYLELIRMEDEATTEDIIHKIQLPGADAIIVQLPLPPHIDTEAVLAAIPVSLDADVLSPAARDLFNKGENDALLPPVTDAAKEILERAEVDPKGKRVVVVGSGWLVGEPTATWFKNQGALVTVLTRESTDLSALKEAQIIVSGAGVPNLIKPEHLSPGVVLIDAGTSESGGQMVGDADPACKDIAAVFTPVPGGVGPVAVACLFRNAAKLINRRHLQDAQKDV